MNDDNNKRYQAWGDGSNIPPSNNGNSAPTSPQGDGDHGSITGQPASEAPASEGAGESIGNQN